MSEDFSKYNGEGTSLRKAQTRLLEMLVEIDRVCKKHNITYWIDGGTPLGAVRHGGFIPWDDDIDIALLRRDYKKLIKILPRELPDRFVLQNRNNERCFHLNYSRVVDKNSLSDYGDDRVPTRKKMKYQGLFLDIVYVEKGFFAVKERVDFFYAKVFYSLTLNESMAKRIYARMLWPLILVIITLSRMFTCIIPTDSYIFGFGIPFRRKLKKSELLPAIPIEFEGLMFSGPNNVHGYLKRYYGENYMEPPPLNDRIQHADKIEVYTCE